MVVLLFFFLEILAGFAVLVDQPKFELVEVFPAELKLARGMFAAFNFAVQSGGAFLLGLTLFLIAHKSPSLFLGP